MARPAHGIFCFETLDAQLHRRPLPLLADIEESYAAYVKQAKAQSAQGKEQAETDEATPAETPVFVTWNTVDAYGDKSLRGCIGTFEAQETEDVLRRYALIAALEDTRFPPIPTSLLPNQRNPHQLSVGITLLTDFEDAADKYDWELGTHGIRISFTGRGRRYGGTYLPDVPVEQGWDKPATLSSLMRKAGWRGSAAEAEGVKIKLVRYQGRKVEVGGAEWVAWRAWRGGQ